MGELRQLVLVERTVTSELVRAYADLANDFNPIHLDVEFARARGLRACIAHGTFSLNLIWQSLQETFGSDALRGAKLSVKFLKPVFVDDVIVAGGAMVEGEDGGSVWVRNQSGETVISGEASLAA